MSIPKHSFFCYFLKLVEYFTEKWNAVVYVLKASFRWRVSIIDICMNTVALKTLTQTHSNIIWALKAIF